MKTENYELLEHFRSFRVAQETFLSEEKKRMLLAVEECLGTGAGQAINKRKTSSQKRLDSKSRRELLVHEILKM